MPYERDGQPRTICANGHDLAGQAGARFTCVTIVVLIGDNATETMGPFDRLDAERQAVFLNNPAQGLGCGAEIAGAVGGKDQSASRVATGRWRALASGRCAAGNDEEE
jgi:hypothetical protein